MLLDFLDEKSPSSSHLTDKGVAVMCRRFSSLQFGKKPEPYRRPWSLGRRAKNGVSYCYAIVKPTNELATRYEEKMKGSSTEDKRRTGLLSDQDLLEDFLGDNFLLMTHEFIAYPSWWMHTDVCWRIWPKLTKNKETQGDATFYDAGRRMAREFGAAHMSQGFHAINVDKAKQRMNKWRDSLTDGAAQYNNACPAELDERTWRAGGYFQTRDIQNIMDAMAGVQDAVLLDHLRQKVKVVEDIKECMKHYAPMQGLSKALIYLTISSSEMDIYAQLSRGDQYMRAMV